MRSLRSFVVLVALAASAGAAALPAQPQAPRPAQPAPADRPASPGIAETVGVTASRVAVDLVVRDKKGRLVRDLKPGEIELLEDGAAQEVLSLRLVDTLGGARVTPEAAAPAAVAGAPKPAPRAAGTAAGGVPATDEQPLFLAFLFDRLSPQARRTAHDAAVEWLQRAASARRYVGVFRIDQGLEIVQSFGEDPQAAIAALDAVLNSSATAYRSGDDRERLRGLRRTMIGFAQGGSPAGAAGSLPAQSGGAEVGALDVARDVRGEWDRFAAFMRLRAETAMLEALEALDRDQQGLTTVNALLSLVNGLKTAPGRKAVVFFSEGLVLPPRVASTMQSLIAESNRAGVTFYTADAAGLRTVSGADESRRELAGIVDELRMGQDASSGRVLTKAMERNEDMLRSDPAAGLGRLASGTGGFLISDTNAISKSLRAAEEDLASYYLLEYSPSNELWDGRFRRIEARVKRPGVHVQARQGYFAVKTAMPTPLLDFEAPVLAALEMAPRARDLAFRATVAQVPDQQDESAVPVLVELAGDVPTIDLREKEKRYQQDFTVLVLVRDEAGRVVRKLSRRFANSGPLEKADEARRGRLLVLRETWLPPGRYTIEIAVQDAFSGRLGVERTPLEVGPAGEAGLRVSSLVLVGHAAARGEGPAEAPALVAQGMQIYPGGGSAVSISAGLPLPFFLVAQSAAGRPAPSGLVELRKGETAVFSAPVAFVQAIGRSTLLGGVPLEGLAPGDYELRVSVGDGVDRAVRWARVALAP